MSEPSAVAADCCHCQRQVSFGNVLSVCTLRNQAIVCKTCQKPFPTRCLTDNVQRMGEQALHDFRRTPLIDSTHAADVVQTETTDTSTLQKRLEDIKCTIKKLHNTKDNLERRLEIAQQSDDVVKMNMMITKTEQCLRNANKSRRVSVDAPSRVKSFGTDDCVTTCNHCFGSIWFSLDDANDDSVLRTCIAGRCPLCGQIKCLRCDRDVDSINEFLTHKSSTSDAQEHLTQSTPEKKLEPCPSASCSARFVLSEKVKFCPRCLQGVQQEAQEGLLSWAQDDWKVHDTGTQHPILHTLSKKSDPQAKYWLFGAPPPEGPAGTDFGKDVDIKYIVFRSLAPSTHLSKAFVKHFSRVQQMVEYQQACLKVVQDFKNEVDKQAAAASSFRRKNKNILDTKNAANEKLSILANLAPRSICPAFRIKLLYSEQQTAFWGAFIETEQDINKETAAEEGYLSPPEKKRRHSMAISRGEMTPRDRLCRRRLAIL